MDDLTRLREMKAAILSRLYHEMRDDRASDGPLALAALCEATAEFGCLLVGKQVTKSMLTELSRQIDCCL